MYLMIRKSIVIKLVCEQFSMKQYHLSHFPWKQTTMKKKYSSSTPLLNKMSYEAWQIRNLKILWSSKIHFIFQKSLVAIFQVIVEVTKPEIDRPFFDSKSSLGGSGFKWQCYQLLKFIC